MKEQKTWGNLSFDDVTEQIIYLQTPCYWEKSIPT